MKVFVLKLNKLLIITTTLLFITVLSFSAHAAEIGLISRNHLFMSGSIKRGDADRLSSYLSGKEPIISISIDSPGGLIEEAMRMSSLIKGAHLTVMVTSGGVCASSCFLLFLSGEPRQGLAANDDGTFPINRRKELIGLVGIHRPYFNAPNGDPSSMNDQEELMRNFRSHLTAKGVPQRLIDEMMSRASNDIYWLSERDLDQLGEYDPGMEEVLVAKCGYKRFSKMYDEKWSKEKSYTVGKCVSDFWYDNRLPLQAEYQAKLRNGWRPWKK